MYMLIERNEKCPCGSGLKYKKCCMEKEDMQDDHIDLPVQSRVEQMVKAGRIKRCIHPNQEECSERIIQAHSIQNNKILNKIAKNGKIVMFRPEFTETSFNITGQTKGRKIATTFTGFCGFHDKVVFQPIEDKNYAGSPEHDFLYAYRAFAFEYHKKHEAYNALCLKIKSKPSLLKEDWFARTLRGHEAGLNDLAYYKKEFDKAIIDRNYRLIETLSLRYNGSSFLAVCSGFFLEYDISGNKLNDVRSLDVATRLKLITFNIFPQLSETIVLFSWLKEDSDFYANFKSQIYSLSPREQINVLNNLIPCYCENAAFSPDYLDSLTNSEKKALSNAFRFTLSYLDDFQKKSLLHDPKYNLFRDLNF